MSLHQLLLILGWPMWIAIGAWAVTYPAGWLIAYMLREKRRRLSEALTDAADLPPLGPPSRGFDDGGAVIGRLERLLIYVFVLSDELAAVGFLVAAKGVFRFGELSSQTNRMEAEYITIGTMQSFAAGLIVSILFRGVLDLLIRVAV